ncbi:MAG: Gfo/Idh/MocA family oxidoreductase [Oscillospiraceae bacterium]
MRYNSKTHIPAYLKNKRLKLSISRYSRKSKKAVEDYGCGIAITDYHEILKDSEVEAVSVCTPNTFTRLFR